MIWKSDREARAGRVRLIVVIWVAITLMLIISAMLPSKAGAQEIHEPDVTAEMAGGGGAVWIQDEVTVLLFADDYWMPILRNTVRDANRALPRKGPKLTPIERGPRDCDDVARETFSGPTITICASSTPTWWSGSAWLRAKHHVVRNERATLEVISAGDLDYDRNTACHEMMHGLDWVDDDYNYPKQGASCVHGNAPTFGKWDRKRLAWSYEKHDQKEREHKGRRGGKQGGKRHH